MLNNSVIKGLSAKEVIILLVVVLIGYYYVNSVQENAINQAEKNVLQIARSVEASLSKTELQSLPENPKDLREQDFKTLKNTLQHVIK